VSVATTTILRDCWCEDAMQGDYAPEFWRSLAKFEKALTDSKLKPVRVLTADRRLESDAVFVNVAVECEPGRSTMPFWKWWIDQDAAFGFKRSPAPGPVTVKTAAKCICAR
jgi:hypothetical protein